MQLSSDATRPRIEIFSHHFTVKNIDGRVDRAIADLSRGLVEWGQIQVPGPKGRPVFKYGPVRVYAFASKQKTEFRFCSALLEDFFNHLAANGVKREDVTVVNVPLYEPTYVQFKWKSPKEPRDLQPKLIDYFSAPITNETNARLITAQTGFGKGLVSIRAILNLGMRTAIVVKPGYMSKWEEELDELLDLKKKDIMVIRGSDALGTMLEMAVEGSLEAKILLISNKTLQLYLKSYDVHTGFDEQYCVTPEEMYKTLGVGVRLIDEVHQDFHLNFKQNCYAHIPLTLSLSATLEADKELLNRMYRLLWPIGTRGPEVPYKKYIAATCLWYRIEKVDRIRYKDAKKNYSHIEFENSIMRNKQMLDNYLKIPELVIRSRFIPLREDGQKMLIFCSTIAMCTLMTEYIGKTFPQFTVARYVGEDEWEALHTNDIVISTIQSAGTAVDIKNLRFTLMTVALSNKQTNLQVLGRLRELKGFKDNTPEFMFLSCQNIGKHAEYAHAKEPAMRGKVKTFSQAFLPIVV